MLGHDDEGVKIEKLVGKTEKSFQTIRFSTHFLMYRQTSVTNKRMPPWEIAD
jgi:hypothetical protein